HHIVKALISSTNLQDVDEAIVRARERLESLNTIKFALKGPHMVKCRARHNLNRSERAHDVARQPDFAVAASAYWGDEFMIWNLNSRPACALYTLLLPVYRLGLRRCFRLFRLLTLL